MNGAKVGAHLRAFALLLGAAALMATHAVQAETRGGRMAPSSAGAKNAASKPSGKLAEVNGANLHYEIVGRGRPVVLVQLDPRAKQLGSTLVSALAKGRRLIAVDLQELGQSGDVDGPARVETMADAIVELIAKLELDRPDVMGYSLGGRVALQIAIRHPKSLGKLVVVSAPMRRSAYYPGIQVKEDFDDSRDVAQIEAATLIVAADADIFPAAHAVEFFGLLGGGARDPGRDGSGRPPSQLAILPGLTHHTIVSSPGLAAMVLAFLDDRSPAM